MQGREPGSACCRAAGPLPAASSPGNPRDASAPPAPLLLSSREVFGILLSPVPQPWGGKGRFAPGRPWLGCARGSAGPCPLGCAEEEEEERAARKAERDGEGPRALGDRLVPAN